MTLWYLLAQLHTTYGGKSQLLQQCWGALGTSAPKWAWGEKVSLMKGMKWNQGTKTLLMFTGCLHDQKEHRGIVGREECLRKAIKMGDGGWSNPRKKEMEKQKELAKQRGIDGSRKHHYTVLHNCKAMLSQLHIKNLTNWITEKLKMCCLKQQVWPFFFSLLIEEGGLWSCLQAFFSRN